MNQITKKFSKLTKEQSKALAGQMNSAYKGGSNKTSSKTAKRPPSKGK